MPIGRNSSTDFKVGSWLAALALAALAAGCQQTPNEASSTGAVDTGTYPNLNIRPGVANQQLTPEELAAARAEMMQAADYNQGRDSRAPNDVEVLQWLAKNHAKDALKKIESGG